MSSLPQTLAQMAGLPATPHALSESTVVLIDCQNEYVTGPLALEGILPALDAVAGLLARARALGTPVVHVAHAGAAGSLFDRAAERGAFCPQAVPRPGEAVIEKPLPNAFARTALDQTLRALGRPSVILAGFMTHMCVSSTARAALDVGWPLTILAAATATRPLPDPLVPGAVVPAAEIARATLTALSDRFARIAPTLAELPD